MDTAESSAEFVGQYVAELQDLTFNSKALINTLTMLANENKHASVGIAEAIERRILNVSHSQAAGLLPGTAALSA